ncbi:hypothetical protein AVEN_162778-1, partial [Araneus ventricosus]
RGICGLVVRSRFRDRRVESSKSDCTEDPQIMGLITCDTIRVVKRPPAVVMRKFVERMPAQITSSLTYSGSKLLNPPQNSHRVASKWNVNTTKTN